MTERELLVIHNRWNWILVDALPEATQAKADIRALYDEVARWREIGRVLIARQETSADTIWTDRSDEPMRSMQLVAKARALLGDDA